RFTTFPTLDNDLDLSIFLPLRLQDTSDRPDREDLVRIRLIDRRVVLRCKKDVALAGHSLFQSLDRTWPSDLESNFRKGKYDHIPDRDHRISPNVGRHLIAEFLHRISRDDP